MELSKKIAILALSGFVCTAVTSCSSSDDDALGTEGTQGTVTPPSTEPGAVDPTVTGVLTSSEAGTYIENTATKLNEICKPQEQQGAVASLMTIANVFEAYNFAGDDKDDESYPYSVANAARAMAQGTRSGDYAAVSRAVQHVSQSFEVNPSQYLGVYTPVYDSEEKEYYWSKTAESSNAIIFRSEQDGVEVSLTVSPESWTGKFTTSDYDYDGYWDDQQNTWVSQDTETTTHWTVSVPAKMTLAMVHNGVTAASAVVESNFNESAHTFTVNASVSVANIQANAQTSGTDSKIIEKCNANIGNTRVLYSVGEVNGSNLCDRQKIEQIANAGHQSAASQIDNMFKNANVKVDFLDRIQLTSTCSSLKQIVAASDYDDENLSEVNAFANALNSNVKTTLKFGNTDYEQGTVTWGAMNYNDYGYTWYEVEPMIKLAGGSAMSLGDFIDSSAVSGSVTAINRIIETYCRAFNIDL